MKKRIAKLPAFERAVAAAGEAAGASAPHRGGPCSKSWPVPSFIRQVLARAYPVAPNIDRRAPWRILHRPSTDPGAAESFGISFNLFDDHSWPLSCWQGLSVAGAPLSGASGTPGKARRKRWSGVNNSTAFRKPEGPAGLGLAPHRRSPPSRVNPVLLEWLEFGESENSAMRQSGKRRGDQAT